ncbi:MAG: autotransporter-associated beta strand repeat-containing protein [Pseudomonadota bacterium]
MICKPTAYLNNVKPALKQKGYGCRLNAWYVGVRQCASPKFRSKCVRVMAFLFTLSCTSTYATTTTIDFGSTSIADLSGFSSVVVNGTYDINGAVQTLKNVSGSGTLTNSGASKTLTLSSILDTTFSGTIAATTPANLKLTKSGSGTLTLTGANTYTGATTFSAVGGTLQIGNGGIIGSIAAGVNTSNGTLIFNRSDDYTYAGAISGTGTLTQAGTGILTLSGSYSSSGTINLNAGKLRASNLSTQGALGTSTVIFGGGILQAGDNITLRGSTHLDNTDSTLDVNQFTVTYIENIISGACGLTISSTGGSGTVIMSGAGYLNTYTGPTMINSGVTVKGSVATSVGVTVNGTYDLNGTALGLIDPSGSGTIQSSTSNAALTITSTNGSTFAGTLASTLSGLTKGGAGTLVLSATNNHSGSTAVSLGKLTLAHHTAASSGTIALDSGTTLEGNFSNNAEIANAITITSSATLRATQAFTTTGGISGSGDLTISGSGGVTFGTANTYTGTTTLQSGAILSISDTTHLSSTTALIMGNNTTLRVTGNCSLPPIVLS